MAKHVKETLRPRGRGSGCRDIERAFELLAALPDPGHRREDLTQDDEIRFWTVGPTLIAYRTTIDWI
jgi:hypothetical protein